MCCEWDGLAPLTCVCSEGGACGMCRGWDSKLAPPTRICSKGGACVIVCPMNK